MKNHTRILALLSLAIIACLLPSCTVAARSQVRADGSKDTQLYAQVGGKGGYAGQADGSMVAQADNEKSFRDAAVLAGVVIPAAYAAKAEIAATTAANATRQTEVKAAAKVEETLIKTTGSTATSLGNNPEANVGAIDAVGRIFRK